VQSKERAHRFGWEPSKNALASIARHMLDLEKRLQEGHTSSYHPVCNKDLCGTSPESKAPETRPEPHSRGSGPCVAAPG